MTPFTPAMKKTPRESTATSSKKTAMCLEMELNWQQDWEFLFSNNTTSVQREVLQLRAVWRLSTSSLELETHRCTFDQTADRDESNLIQAVTKWLQWVSASEHKDLCTKTETEYFTIFVLTSFVCPWFFFKSYFIGDKHLTILLPVISDLPQKSLREYP